MNLSQLGYIVVDSGSNAATGAPSLAIAVDHFWVENDPTGGTNKKSFDCAFRFSIVSDSEPFDKMTTVSGTGFRNGSRPTSTKSYANSLQHSLKFVMKDFAAKYDAALRSFAKAEILSST